MLRKVNKLPIFWIFAIATFIRTPFIFFPSMHVDILLYQVWTDFILKHGLVDFYHTTHSDYFPGYLYLLYLAGSIFKITTILSFVTSQFELFLKFLNGLFDIGTAYFIYLILKQNKQKWAILSSLIYLFNPVTIFNSLVWGQSDGIMIFFVIAAVYFFIECKRYIVWTLFFTFSLLVKPQSVLITPLLFLFDSKIRFLFFLAAGLILAIIASAPFFPGNEIFGLVDQFKTSTSIYPFTSIYADNFWQLFGWFRPDSQIFGFLTLQQWGYVLFASSIIVITFLFIREKTKANFYLASSLYFLSFFLFLTRIHERYLIFTLPFLLIATFLIKKRLWTYYAVLSIVHFANIWFVYFLLNYTDTANALAGNVIFILLKSKLLSVITLGIFFLLLFELLRSRNSRTSQNAKRNHALDRVN